MFAGLDINLASLTQTVAKTEADLFVKSSFHPKMLILTQKETEMTVSNQFINFNFYLAMTDPRSQRPKGQIKPKAVSARRRFSQKNEPTNLFCLS